MRTFLALIVFALSAFGPGVTYAAYCMSTFTSSGRTYFIQGSQPSNASTCAFIAISGSEWNAYTNAITVNDSQNSEITSLQLSNSINVIDISILRSDVNILRNDVNTESFDINTIRTDVNGFTAQLSTLTTNVGNINAGMNTPFDYTFAAGVFSLFFASVVSLWWVSKSAGTLIDAIRKW